MRAVHMDFHMPEFPVDAIKNFDAERFVDLLERGKINMVALFAKCHFGNSFYNTKCGHKHSGLKEDFLMETALECRKRGIFTYAYYSLCTDVHAYREHENWHWIGRDGNPSGVNGPWARLCLNTPYKDELVIPQLAEIISDYPVDALWLDIPLAKNTDGCFCEYCKQKYFMLYGKKLDQEFPVREGIGWNFQAAGTVVKEVKNIIVRSKKDILVCSNRSGHIETPLAFTEAHDILCWESQPRNNYLSHSFTARYVRTLDVPAQVMSVRFYQGWGDLTLKPEAQMTTEFAAMIGNGVSATSGDQVNVDGTLQAPVYDMFSNAFGFVQSREKLLRTAYTVPDVCILAPVPAYDKPAPYAQSDAVKGAHKMLVESHIQFDILSSQKLELLDRYSMVVLPEPCDYSEEVFKALELWVSDGGTLLACGRSTIMKGHFHLKNVFGIEYLEPSVFSVSHFKPHIEVRGDTDDLILQCRAATQKVYAESANVLADYYYPQTESISERAFRNRSAAPPAGTPSPYSFVTENSYGKGRAVYIAGSVFEAYWKYNHHWLRQSVAALYRYLFPQPLYRIDGPQTMETNLMKTKTGALLLNIINYQFGHQGDRDAIPSIESVFPFYNLKCEVRTKGVKQLTLEPEGNSVDFIEEGGYIFFTIPEFLCMAMVKIEHK